MQLPNWFKVCWWIVITVFTGCLFAVRWDAISSGQSTAMDIVIFLVLVALLLAPIFQEISLLGLKFRQQVEKLQTDIEAQIANLRIDLQNSISNNVNTNVTVGSAPPSDDELPELEERIRRTLHDYLGGGSDTPLDVDESPSLKVDSRTDFLFRVRYQIERHLRDIAKEFRVEGDTRRPIPIRKLSSWLVHEEVLSARIAHAITEVYAVCSPALHGEPFSDAQFEFVRDTGPEVIRALEKVRTELGV